MLCNSCRPFSTCFHSVFTHFNQQQLYFLLLVINVNGGLKPGRASLDWTFLWFASNFCWASSTCVHALIWQRALILEKVLLLAIHDQISPNTFVCYVIQKLSDCYAKGQRFKPQLTQGFFIIQNIHFKSKIEAMGWHDDVPNHRCIRNCSNTIVGCEELSWKVGSAEAILKWRQCWTSLSANNPRLIFFF